MRERSDLYDARVGPAMLETAQRHREHREREDHQLSNDEQSQLPRCDRSRTRAALPRLLADRAADPTCNVLWERAWPRVGAATARCCPSTASPQSAARERRGRARDHAHANSPTAVLPGGSL